MKGCQFDYSSKHKYQTPFNPNKKAVRDLLLKAVNNASTGYTYYDWYMIWECTLALEQLRQYVERCLH